MVPYAVMSTNVSIYESDVIHQQNTYAYHDPCMHHHTNVYISVEVAFAEEGEIRRTVSYEHTAMATPAEVYKTGFLYKRQRGRRSKDLQKLKFQERVCQLTTTAFEYYKARRTVITHRLSNPGFAFDSFIV